MADIKKSYVKINVWKETHQALINRHRALNEDLKAYGAKKVPMTRFIDVIAKKSKVNLFPDDVKELGRRR